MARETNRPTVGLSVSPCDIIAIPSSIIGTRAPILLNSLRKYPYLIFIPRGRISIARPWEYPIRPIGLPCGSNIRSLIELGGLLYLVLQDRRSGTDLAAGGRRNPRLTVQSRVVRCKHRQDAVHDESQGESVGFVGCRRAVPAADLDFSPHF